MGGNTTEGRGNKRDTTACCDNSSSPEKIEMVSTRSYIKTFAENIDLQMGQ